jgi:hypothetical protein
MKHFLWSAFLFSSFLSLGCDNCALFLSSSPDDYKNSIGLFYRQRNMFGKYNGFGEIMTQHANHGNDQALWNNNVQEIYQTYELRGTYYFKPKWKTLVVLPLVNNLQIIEDEVRYQVQGIGDPTIVQFYQLYNTQVTDKKHPVIQQLNIGLGLKMPLGKTNRRYENGVPNLDLQPGSGSWDVLSVMTYSLQWRFIGFTSNFSFKFNGENQENYRYGHTFNGKADVFLQTKMNKLTLRGYGGLYNEYATFDTQNYDKLYPTDVYKHTGGSLLYATGGIQLFYQGISLFAEVQNMIQSDLNGFTQLNTKNKFNLGLAYNF